MAPKTEPCVHCAGNGTVGVWTDGKLSGRAPCGSCHGTGSTFVETKPQPFLTLRFYADGDCETIPGPEKYPEDTESVKKISGTILLLLWQIGQIGFQKMVAHSVAEKKMLSALAQVPTDGVH